MRSAARRSICRPARPAPGSCTGAARLEGPATQDLGAGPLHGRGRCHHLLVGLRRAGAGHHDHFVATDPHIVDGDDGVFRLERAAGALVGLGDAQHLVHAVKELDELLLDLVGADDAEHRPRGAGRAVHVHPELDQPGDDRVDLRLRGALLHDDNHYCSPIRHPVTGCPVCRFSVYPLPQFIPLDSPRVRRAALHR